jgi:NMD protein affecting ribosome stability and mRNA decay
VYCLVRTKDFVTRPDGTKVVLNNYRCRRCGASFNDDKWRSDCTAPDTRTAADREYRARLEQENALEKCPPNMQEALKEFLKMRPDLDPDKDKKKN